MQTLDTALSLARRGLKLFRLAAGTRGGEGNYIDYDWKFSASNDLVEVFERFNGRLCNIGVATSGLVVVDVDVKGGKQGLASMRELDLDLNTLTVRTTTGGLHLYYDAGGALYGNSVSNIAPGIDIRAHGGYVVGPGSQINGTFYVVERDLPIAKLPAALAQRLVNAVDRKSDGATVGDLDTPPAIAAAVEYLRTAPVSVEGFGGNLNAFKVACRVMDCGVSGEKALEVLQDWNGRCLPPWSDDELERVVTNAAQYRQDPAGRDNPAEGFEAVEPEAPAPSAFASLVKPYMLTEEDEALLPPRAWLAKGHLIHGRITALIAPGGVGKSLLSLQWALGVVLGPEVGKQFGLDIVEPANVLVINEEDDLDEMEMRLAAAIRNFGLDRSAIYGKLHLYSGVNHKFLTMKRKGRALEATKQLDELKAFAREKAIGLIIVDPLVESHEADENNNSEMASVMGHWRAVAAETGAAVLMVHHTRKANQASADGHAGNADSGRGASAIINAARIGLTLYSMSPKDAKALGVPEHRRNRYIRLDDSKVNLTLVDYDSDWFERLSVQLPNGESIGVLKPVTLSAAKGVDANTIAQIVAPYVAENGPISYGQAAKMVLDTGFFEDMSATTMQRRIAELKDLPGLHREASGAAGGTISLIVKN